jgi:hypothetical protein
MCLYANSITPNKILKTFLIEDFFLWHRTGVNKTDDDEKSEVENLVELSL